MGGSLLNQVPKTFTAAEAMVLQTLHGDDALKNIQVSDQVATQWTEGEGEDDPEKVRTDLEERSRLQFLYGAALRKVRNVESIEGIFGIRSMPLPKTIVGVDDVELAEAKPKKVPRDMSKLNEARARKKREREEQDALAAAVG